MPHAAVLSRYCAGCHNQKLKSGGFALDGIAATPVAHNAPAWEKVVRKLRTRQMPPEGLPRPDEAGYESTLASLTAPLDSLPPNPGRTDTFRRLNRTEYRNAVRDLLSLDVDVSALLPVDESSHGFDNVTVGELSPSLLEKYLSAAQKISRLAVGAPVRAPGGHTVYVPPDLTQEGEMAGLPFGTRGGTRLSYTFPLDAEYEIQLRLSRDRDERVEGLLDPHELELSLDGERLKVFPVRRPPREQAHHGVDKDFNVRVTVKAGPHEITAAFLKKSAALADSERQPYLARYNADRHPRAQPAVYSISILGPYGAGRAGDTPSRRRIFSCQPAQPADEPGCAQRILSAILRRAYRRALSPSDLAMPLRFYNEARAAGSFETGIEMALRAILASPRFLFRVERDPPRAAPGAVYRLSDVEIASRLSFFLWSSIPDDALLDAAVRGELADRQVLARHVNRMLQDERASALVTNFASQWLYLRNLDSASPDPRLFPDFDDNLRQALRTETEMFIGSILRDNRSVLDLLRANYTFLNERLAKHYGIPGVYGNQFRRVELGDSSMRGGLLSHGSILTVTSYANRTSPVVRGKWILTNLIGTPPAPPPAEVPPLKEANAKGKALTMRDRVAEHRANPACASCHNLLDPVGFALENYDAVGRWRTEDEGAPVDATGALPDGRKFDRAAGLQSALLDRPEMFVHTLSEKLLVYALGRGVESYDAPAVRRVIRETRGQDFRFQSIIQTIVQSAPFQMRRTP